MVMKMMNVIMQNDIASLKIGISVLFIVFMAIICVVIYLNEKLFAEKMDIEKQKNVIAENKLLEEGIKNINELYEKNSKNFHEFKHHLDVLNSFAKKGDCDKINENLASFKLDDNIGKRFNTGNEIIDMVLNAKTKVIAKENINFSIDVSLNENFAISNNDLCSLLSNLIDNSIEACVKCSVRKIKLYIINKGNFTVITITNTSIENPTLSGFATNKTGNHGWGMSIINDIVKKYDGISEHTYEDNIFKTKIILFTGITD
jgi:sensor histidine kinase regulating citrate/malate metabolism